MKMAIEPARSQVSSMLQALGKRLNRDQEQLSLELISFACSELGLGLDGNTLAASTNIEGRITTPEAKNRIIEALTAEGFRVVQSHSDSFGAFIRPTILSNVKYLVTMGSGLAVVLASPPDLGLETLSQLGLQDEASWMYAQIVPFSHKGEVVEFQNGSALVYAFFA